MEMKKASGTGAHIKGKGEIMLKKKEWLRLWKSRILASGEFDPHFVNSRSHVAVLDMKDGLTPNGSADGVVETMKELKHAFKSGS